MYLMLSHLSKHITHSFEFLFFLLDRCTGSLQAGVTDVVFLSSQDQRLNTVPCFHILRAEHYFDCNVYLCSLYVIVHIYVFWLLAGIKKITLLDTYAHTNLDM